MQARRFRSTLWATHASGAAPKPGNRPAREVTTADVVSLIEFVGRTLTCNVAERAH
jgi:hypothetical protein